MSDWAIETEGLGKRFGRKWAVRDLDLHVSKGSVFGLLGPNGAGKSTTIQMLTGVLPASEGRISVLGIDPTEDDVAIRRRVGYVPEIHGFYEWMGVSELIGLVAPYHNDWDWDACQALEAEFDLDGRAKVRSLSKGMRAKLALLLALSFDPEMLILDEPTGGLDPAARRSFIETIVGRYQKSGKTILVASHLINEIAPVLDHVAFLKESKLYLASPLDDLHKRTKRVRLVFDGEVPSDLKLDGAVAVRCSGREAVVTLKGFDPNRTPKELAETGASSVNVEEMTLEDIFVDLVAT